MDSKIKLRRATTLLVPMVFAMVLCTGNVVSGQTATSTMPPEDNNMNHHTVPPQTMPPNDNDNDITHRQIADMDRFLDSHPEIAEQLRKDPSLIDNREFVQNHPSLQEYLQKHPGVRESFSQNPNAFMHREERYDRQDDRFKDKDKDNDRRDDRRAGDTDITRRQVAEMDRFLDSHPELAEQLRKDPSLVNNHQFVENHPALQEYLQKHPEIHEELSENPNAFMRRENRYDNRANNWDGRQHAGEDRKGDRQGELTSFGQFLGNHSAMAEQLSKDPSLANNKEYLANHPELDEYLKAHPAMTQQLAESPQTVMASNWVQQGATTGARPSTPKPKPNPNQ